MNSDAPSSPDPISSGAERVSAGAERIPPGAAGIVSGSDRGPLRVPGGFPVVGIIGGGQLARMCAPPAVGLCVQLSVLAESVDASAALVVPSAPVGAHDDVEAVRAFARHCDVVTFDHEHVPAHVLAALQADGAVLRPSPAALRYAQDKLAMRERLGALGIPCPRWARVRSEEELRAFGDEVGWPVVLKAPRGGYDGKGVRLVHSPDEARDWLDQVERVGENPYPDPGDDDNLNTMDVNHNAHTIGVNTIDNNSGGARGDGGRVADPRGFAPAFADGILAEERVGFRRELAALVARSPSGQAAAWPIVETVQTDGICTEVLAPAPGLDEDAAVAATHAALRIAGDLDVTGVLAVELFELAEVRDDGARFVVNELAMRPHNSGHWTIDGAVTSQFEQHLRAVLDLPLGDPQARDSWSVMGNVLGGSDESLYDTVYATYRHLFARDPALRMHLYGKGMRPGRKVGHVTVCGDDLADLRDRARHATDYLSGAVRE